MIRATLCLAVLCTLGCGRGELDNLQTVPLPDLSGSDASVRMQIGELHAAALRKQKEGAEPSAVGAAFGVTVLVFQHGYGGGLFGLEGPTEAIFCVVPVIVFATVFGLSMDYEVFLVSRIHEEWVHRKDASRAVVHGLASTGRVITAAATIMVCVFLSFALIDERAVKMFGLSLASAVFLDAFVVRSLLLPAVLQLLGRATWWLPRGLDRRLPHLAIEPPERPPVPALQEG